MLKKPQYYWIQHKEWLNESVLYQQKGTLHLFYGIRSCFLVVSSHLHQQISHWHKVRYCFSLTTMQSTYQVSSEQNIPDWPTLLSAGWKVEFNAAGISLLSETKWVCILGYHRCLDCFLWGATTLFQLNTFIAKHFSVWGDHLAQICSLFQRHNICTTGIKWCLSGISQGILQGSHNTWTDSREESLQQDYRGSAKTHEIGGDELNLYKQKVP